MKLFSQVMVDYLFAHPTRLQPFQARNVALVMLAYERRYREDPLIKGGKVVPLEVLTQLIARKIISYDKVLTPIQIENIASVSYAYEQLSRENALKKTSSANQDNSGVRRDSPIRAAKVDRLKQQVVGSPLNNNNF